MALSCWEKIAIVIIIAVLLRIGLRLVVFTWKKFLAPNLNLSVNLKKQGRWAVVTGSTDGLGKAYAEALAKKGINIVLVSRSLSKLEDVAHGIKETYKVETKIVEADLTQGQVVYSKIAKAIEELEVNMNCKIFHIFCNNFL